MSEPHISRSTACSRIDHPEGYVELRFLESSRRAVDQLIEHLKQIVAASAPDKPLLIFVNANYSKTPQPIAYLMGQLRAEKTRLTPHEVARIAVTFNLIPLARMVDLFVRSMRTKNVQFRAYGVREEAQALAWLLDNTA